MATSNDYQAALFRLQELDLTLADIAKKTAEEKAREPNFAKNTAAKTKERERQHTVLTAAQVAVKNLELELEDLNSKKSKKEKQVLMVTDPRQLEAVNTEIAKLNEQIPVKEGELLEAYDKVEKAQAVLHATDEELKKRAATAPRLKVDVANKLKELEAQLKATTEARAAHEPTVDAVSLAKYNQARKAKPEAAVLFAILENACGGCGLPRPDPEWNKLRSNPGKIYECSDCERLNTFTGEFEL